MEPTKEGNKTYLPCRQKWKSPGSSTAKSRMKSYVLMKASFSSENLFKDSRFWFTGELLKHEDENKTHNSISGFQKSEIDSIYSNSTNYKLALRKFLFLSVQMCQVSIRLWIVARKTVGNL